MGGEQTGGGWYSARDCPERSCRHLLNRCMSQITVPVQVQRASRPTRKDKSDHNPNTTTIEDQIINRMRAIKTRPERSKHEEPKQGL
jgi:hypothetical protein